MNDEEIILSYQDYANAIINALSPKQIEFLQYFYYCPNKSATAKQLAEILSPMNPAPIISKWSNWKNRKNNCGIFKYCTSGFIPWRQRENSTFMVFNYKYRLFQGYWLDNEY